MWCEMSVLNEWETLPKITAGNCPICGKEMVKHIIREGSRLHVHSYSSQGIRCSEPDCEDNHKHWKECDLK